MIDLHNPRSEDFTLVDTSSHEASVKVRPSFFRVKTGTIKPVNANRYIASMPKELYNEYFQKGI